MKKFKCVLPLLCSLLIVIMSGCVFPGCASIPGYGDLSPAAKAELWLDEIDLFMADVEAYFVEYKGEEEPESLREAKFLYGVAKRRIVSLMEKLAGSTALTTAYEERITIIQDRLAVVDETVE